MKEGMLGVIAQVFYSAYGWSISRGLVVASHAPPIAGWSISREVFPFSDIVELPDGLDYGPSEKRREAGRASDIYRI